MNTSQTLHQLSPFEFVQLLKRENIKRFYFVTERTTRKLIASHPLLQPIADYFQQDVRDYHRHEAMFFQVSSQYDVMMGAFIHRTNRGQAAGGIRFWEYNTIEDYIRDGMRLATGMMCKNALAGLWWGGGKGVMAHNPAVDKNDATVRKLLYSEYGEFVTSLRGCYVAAEDVGTNVTDMANVFSKTRFTTCIPPALGGSGNPSLPTARGVICGIEAAIEFLNWKSFEGRTAVVQGMGNVGGPVIKFLFERNIKKVIASDINESTATKLKQELEGKNLEVHIVSRGDNSVILAECDILSPCATGAVLNQQTIPLIKAKIICGAANNQLEDSERDDEELFKHGIIYVPDFLTNRMGIVNCANEQYGYVNNDTQIEKHLSKDWKFSIYQSTMRVLHDSKKSGKPTGKIAAQLANRLARINHPVYGHRSLKIIESLVADNWQNG